MNWLTQEIDKGQPNCPKICTFSITGGADPLCANTTSTYTLNVPVPSGVTTQWVLSPNLQLISSTPNSVTIKELTSSTATITANLIDPCGANVVITRQIVAGPPVVNLSYSTSGFCSGSYQTWSLNASSSSTVTSWLWTVDNPSSGSWYISSPNSPTTFIDVSGGGGVSISATNACGTGRNGATIYSNCGHFSPITASPNPTTNDVTVAMTQSLQIIKGSVATANEKKALIFKIIFTDQLGSLKKQYNYSAGVNSAKISLSGLASGTYIIKAFDGANWNTAQVIKQ